MSKIAAVEQNYCICAKLVVYGKTVFGQNVCISTKLDVFGQNVYMAKLYLGKMFVFQQN